MHLKLNNNYFDYKRTYFVIKISGFKTEEVIFIFKEKHFKSKEST